MWLKKKRKMEAHLSALSPLRSRLRGGSVEWVERIARWIYFLPLSFLTSVCFIYIFSFFTSMQHYWLMEWVTRIQSTCCCPAKCNGKWMEWGACWEPKCQESHLWPSTISWHMWYFRSELHKPHNPSPPALDFLSLLWMVGANPCNRMQWRFAVGKLFWG